MQRKQKINVQSQGHFYKRLSVHRDSVKAFVYYYYITRCHDTRASVKIFLI